MTAQGRPDSESVSRLDAPMAIGLLARDARSKS